MTLFEGINLHLARDVDVTSVINYMCLLNFIYFWIAELFSFFANNKTIASSDKHFMQSTTNIKTCRSLRWIGHLGHKKIVKSRLQHVYFKFHTFLMSFLSGIDSFVLMKISSSTCMFHVEGSRCHKHEFLAFLSQTFSQTEFTM